MKLSLELKPLDPDASGIKGQALRFVWDSASGEVAGDSRDAVLARVAFFAGRSFGVPLRAPPDSVRVADPLRSPTEMAVLLGEAWTLPPELESLYPSLDSGPEEGGLLN